ncbi:MAG: YwiC-like family protein, partial [Candidatus Eisenbacteria bacterium]|nr:YwiC-like family protein [Candidatus Eisenbacteria bacterium]
MKIAPPDTTSSLRRVLVPTEHGGWAFLGEPLLLGLLLAPSGAGVCVSLATIAAFFARQPLKLFAADRRRGKVYPRTIVAERAFAACAVVGALAMAAAVALTRGPLLPAVGAAASVAAIALAFDLSRRSRDLAAELAGAIAMGAAASVIALAAGWPALAAFGLWGVLAARALGTIAFVRARLRLERGEPWNSAGVAAWQALAIALAAALAAAQAAPRAAVVAMALLAARAAWGLSPWRLRLRTAMLGVSEIV